MVVSMLMQSIILPIRASRKLYSKAFPTRKTVASVFVQVEPYAGDNEKAAFMWSK